MGLDYHFVGTDYYIVHTGLNKLFSWFAISCIQTVIMCAQIINPCHRIITSFSSIKISCAGFIKSFVWNIKLAGQISKSCERFSKSLAWNNLS